MFRKPAVEDKSKKHGEPLRPGHLGVSFSLFLLFSNYLKHKTFARVLNICKFFDFIVIMNVGKFKMGI